MDKKQLQSIAQALGIKTDGLTVDQLEGAITNTVAAKKNELEATASEAKTALEALPEDADEDARNAAKDAFDKAIKALEGFDAEKFVKEAIAKAEPEKKVQSNKPDAKAGKSKDAKQPKLKDAEAKPSFDYDGEKYVFGKDAPKRFNFFGKNKTQEEWLQDKEAMEALISGRSQYVKRLKK